MSQKVKLFLFIVKTIFKRIDLSFVKLGHRTISKNHIKNYFLVLIGLIFKIQSRIEFVYPYSGPKHFSG